jgi:Raf kinase inhibitor-like YbhB/YbcL family protein
VRAVAVAVLAAVALAGCGGAEKTVKGPPPAAPAEIGLTSPAFDAGGTIPAANTCTGANRPPQLAWTGVPSGAHELVLLMEDPDAPGGTFVHWIVSGIPPQSTGSPVRGHAGRNSFGHDGYDGPCPPEGDTPHRYRFQLYALEAPSGLADGASADAARQAIERSRPLARGVLEGRFGR